MLGWFKKKFRKDEEVAAEVSSEAEAIDNTASGNEAEAVKPPLAPSPAAAMEKTVANEVEDLKKEARKTPKEEPLTTDLRAEKEQSHPVNDGVLPERGEKTEKKSSLFAGLASRLDKTRESFTYQMDALFLGKKEINEEMLDDLEELLVTADIGVATSEELIETARRRVKRKELRDPEGLKRLIKEELKSYILANEQDASLVMPAKGPFIIMVIGVNGVGKTTTIGKIANKFKNVGSSVMLVAADTFRAAAVSQLQIWGERNGVPVIAHREGADPSSVVFDGLEKAMAEDIDVVLVDTAGRMHTKDNLMEELKKIKRVMGKKLPGSPHEVLLVIDATTGQNGISQARLFDAAVEVTGLALTKLDGTSKGGIVANICREMKIPIRFIGVGEKMEDLRDFDADEFTNALFH